MTRIGSKRYARRSPRRERNGQHAYGVYNRSLRWEMLEDRRVLAAGALDSTFGFNGIQLTDFGFADPASTEESAYAAALQPDGKVLVGGYWAAGGSPQYAILARFNANGTLDSSFGSAGMVRLTDDVQPGNPIISLAVQPDGKILAARTFGSGNRDFGLVRFNSNGSLDTSFSGDGKMSVSLSAGDDILSEMALQPDGDIVLAGYMDNGTSSDFAVVRVRGADGSMDTAFGTRTVDFGTFDILTNVAVQADGRIVLVGTTDPPGANNNDVVVARLNSDGTLDSGSGGDTTPGDQFATGGKLQFSFGSTNDQGRALKLDSQGRIVIGAIASISGQWDYAVARLLSTGAFDSSFSGDGKLTFDVPHGGGENDYVNSVVIDGADNILLVGFTESSSANVSLARFTSAGALDTSFGSGTGAVNFDVAGNEDFAKWATLRPDGKIITAGGISNGTDRDFALVQFLANGTRDNSFDGDGVAVAERLLSGDDNGNAMALQPDGKIVVVGSTFVGANQDAIIARYNANGTLDTTFASKGFVVFGWGALADEAKSVAVQSDGRLVVVGQSNNGSNADFAIARFNTDGTLDNSFSSDGKVTYGIGTNDIAFDVAQQTDGKIVVVGIAHNGANYDGAVMQLNADGTKDTAFAVNGTRILAVGSDVDQILAVTIDSSARIVVAGVARTSSNDFLVARLNTNGNLDSSFSGDGIATVDFGFGDDNANDVVIDNNGYIVVAGQAYNGSNDDYALARFDPAGNLDNSFSGDGKLITPIGAPEDFSSEVAVQSNGRIVVAGSSQVGGVYGFSVARYLADGSLDVSFSNDGKLITSFGGGANDARAYGLAIQPDGKIVVAGVASNGSDYDIAVERFLIADLAVPQLITNPAVLPAGVQIQGPVVEVGGIAYFPGSSGSDGDELWRTDGTPDGTYKVKDIVVGTASSVPASLTKVGNTLFFSANDGITGTELWKSDGTTAGTVRVKDIFSGNSGSQPLQLVAMNGELYFIASDGITGNELWRSDGTDSGTYLVKDVRTGSSGSGANSLVTANGILYFNSSDGVNGSELWRSDGTALGTYQGKDIVAGSGGSSPSNLVNANGTLFFRADDGVNGAELWRSDGTSAGTYMVKDLVVGSGSFPLDITNVNGRVFFTAVASASGRELYTSDGTAAGTLLLKDIRSGASSSNISSLAAVNNNLYFQANDGVAGEELWRSDGTPAGTYLLADIRAGSGSSSPTGLTNVNGTLYFAASDAAHGNELWRSDGTAVGTSLYADIDVGTLNSNPNRFTAIRGNLFFAARTAVLNLQSWIFNANKPVANMTAPSFVVEGSTILLEGVGSSTAGGAIVSYEWDVGYNGTFSADFSGSRVNYAAANGPGTEVIALRVTDEYGAQAIATRTVSAQNAAPTIAPLSTFFTEPNRPLTIFTQASDPGTADILTYSWNFGDGSPTESGVNFTARGHTYALAGNYTGTLTVTDNDGASTSTTFTVSVSVGAINFSPSSQSVSESEGVAVIEAYLGAPANQDIVIPLTYSGSAQSTSDYRNAPAQLVIRRGMKSGVAAIALVNDALIESAETLVVTMGTPNLGSVGAAGMHTINIVNDDTAQVGFQLISQTVAEDAGQARVVVWSSAISDQPITIPFSLSGSALLNTDYTLSTGSTVTIPAFQSRAEAVISLQNDSLMEPTEAIVLTLQAVPGVQISAREQVHTILIPQNDAPIASFTSANRLFYEYQGSTSVTVTLSAPAQQLVTIPYSISGTAKQSSDFTVSPASIQIPVGASSAIITLTSINDALAEPNETVVLTLGQPTNAVLGPTTTFTLTLGDDDNRTVGFSPTVGIPNSGYQTYQFREYVGAGLIPVVLSAPAAVDILVHYRVNNIVGLSSGEYSLPAGPLVIPAGQTTGYIHLGIVDDSVTDWNLKQSTSLPRENASDSLTIEIISSDLATVSTGLNGAAPSVAKIDILDDELVATAYISKVKNGYDRVEASSRATYERDAASHTVKVVLSGIAEQNLVIPFQLTGNAKLGSDFTLSNSAAVTIPAGSDRGTLTLSVLNDSKPELADEKAKLKFANVPGIQFDDYSSVTVKILDDDTPGITIYEDPSGSESRKFADYEDSKITFVVQLSQPATATVRIPLEFVGYGKKQATPRKDFKTDVDEIVIPAGQSTGSVTVTLKEDKDKKDAPKEQFSIEFGTPTNALYASGRDTDYRIITILKRPSSTSAPLGTLELDPAVLEGDSKTKLPRDKSEGDAGGPSQALQLDMYAEDGYFQGSTIFFDANFNGVADFLDLDHDGLQDEGEPLEPSGETAIDGSYSTSFDTAFDLNGNGKLDVTEGRWVLVAGTDISTGVTLDLRLFAPVGMGVISPLSTVVESLARLQGLPLEDAMDRVLAAFSLPEVDLSTLDPPYLAAQGDLQAAEVFAAGGMVQNTAVTLTSLLAGIDAALPAATWGELVFSAIAGSISESSSILDLTLPSVITAILAGAANRGGAVVAVDLANAAAVAIAEANRRINELPRNGREEFLSEVATIQAIVQGDLATALRETASGQMTVENLAANYSIAALDLKIANSVFGTVVPSEVIINDVAKFEGAAGSQIFEFVVSIHGTVSQAVSVNYETMDLEARAADGDYVPTSGVLVWQPGDVTTRTIQVTVSADATFEADEAFTILLTSAANAAIRREVGFGTIVNDDAWVFDIPADATDNELVMTADGRRLTVFLNDEPIIDGNFIHPVPMRINGAVGANNTLRVEIESETHVFDAGLEFYAGGGAQDGIILDGEIDLPVTQTLITESSGEFSLDAGTIRYFQVENIEDLTTPEVLSIPTTLTAGDTYSLGSTVGNVVDDQTVDYVWEVRQGGNLIDSGTADNFDFTPPAPGTYELSLAVSSPGRGTGTDALTLTVQERPKITFGGSSGSETDAATQAFSWGVTDSDGDLNTVSVVVRKGATSIHSSTAVSGAFNFDTLGLGNYEIEVSASDLRGAVASATRTVTVTDDDSTGPSISLGGVTLNQTDGGNQVFTWNLSDPSGLDHVSVQVSEASLGTLHTSAAASGSFDFNSYGLGTFTIAVSVDDADADWAGDTSLSILSQSVMVTDDDTAAPVIVLGGSNGTEEETLSQAFTWNVSDASGLGSVTVDVQKTGTGSVHTSAASSGSFNFDAFGPGTYTIIVNATDADNDRIGDTTSSSSNRTVIVVPDDDTAGPVVTLGGSTGAENDDQSQSFNWSISDSSGLRSLLVIVTQDSGGGPVEIYRTTNLADAISNFSFDSYGLGTFALSASATDDDIEAVGDEASGSASRTATITDDDTAGPIITLGGSAGIESHGLTQAFTWNVSDSSGMGSVSVTVLKNSTPIFTSSSASGNYNFDAQGVGNFELQVSATDTDNDFPGDAASSNSSRSVAVTNVAPTDVAVSPSSVPENSSTGTLIGNFGTTDADPNDAFTYTLLDSAGGRFKIVGAQLQVDNGTLLNFEGAMNHTVQVKSEDIFGQSFTKTLSITVTNVNEAPVVSPNTFSAVEQTPNGTVIGTVTANDPDAGTVLTWSITGGNSGGAFAINSSGQITVANSAALVHATNPTFNLTVQATDNGSPVRNGSATVTINLTPAALVKVASGGIVSNGGLAAPANQRSQVKNLVVTFTGLVNIAAGAFEVTKTGTGGGAVGVNFTTATVSGKTVATLTFTGGFVETNGSLKDGNYLLNIRGNLIHDLVANRELDGDGNGFAGGNRLFGNVATDNFFRLFGDSDGDRDVDNLDTARFNSTYGKNSTQAGFLWYFDYEGDNDTDNLDAAQYQLRYGKRMNF